MRSAGVFIAIAGSLLALFSIFAFDTSVATSSGVRVHNLGLLKIQQNMLLLGVSALVVGSLLGIFSKKGPQLAPKADPAADQVRACIQEGTPQQMRALIESGAFDPSLDTSEKFMRQAVYEKRADMVEVLLRGGASASSTWTGGGSMLSTVAKWHDDHIRLHPQTPSPFQAIVDFLSNPPRVDIVPGSSAHAGAQAPLLPVADELAKLAALLEKKVITHEEFSTAKKRLLGS